MKKRLYKFDNIKAILIFCVVFGHLLELVKGYEMVYLFIYTFHMPVFMFVTGYFARFDRKKIINNIVIPYVIFQIAYTCFEIYVMGNKRVTLTFSKPVWLLWYLMVIFFYYMLIPLINAKEKNEKIKIFYVSVGVSLLIGFDNSVGYLFSMSRFFVFLPFFVGGYYIGQEPQLLIRLLKFEKSQKFGFALLAAILYLVLVVYVLKQEILTKHMLYGSYSYEVAHYNIWLRLLIMVIASGFVAMFVVIIPDKRIFLVTDIGKYTMPVFILHGFVVKLVRLYCRQTGNIPDLEHLLLLSVVIVLVFGNKVVNKVFMLH